jgi:nitroimidazol reductase NimA-like FMN-containing flavoprotein (pyridoxamine 5'-phosphate oxidase superfamily)
MASMNEQERTEFLEAVHVGVFALEHPGTGPLTLPIWYLVEDGDVLILMDGDSLKAKLIRASGFGTLTAQSEARPYKYVSVEGPIALEPVPPGFKEKMATRYLGEEAGKAYAATPDGPAAVVARLTPTKWRTTDYGKSAS